MLFFFWKESQQPKILWKMKPDIVTKWQKMVIFATFHFILLSLTAQCSSSKRISKADRKYSSHGNQWRYYHHWCSVFRIFFSNFKIAPIKMNIAVGDLKLMVTKTVCKLDGINDGEEKTFALKLAYLLLKRDKYMRFR